MLSGLTPVPSGTPPSGENLTCKFSWNRTSFANGELPLGTHCRRPAVSVQGQGAPVPSGRHSSICQSPGRMTSGNVDGLRVLAMVLAQRDCQCVGVVRATLIA